MSSMTLTCAICQEPAIAKQLYPLHYGQVARGVLGVERPACLLCGEPISRITKSARPFHRPCKDRAPQWMKDGTPKPEPRIKPAPKLPVDKRSDMRAGHEDGDYARFLSGLSAKAVVTSDGCWEWLGQAKDGYPRLRVGNKDLQVHRMVIEAREGKHLGVLAAHHKCGNSICVSPDHLQPVTQRENVAEMLARNSLEARIRELEGALAALAPAHPILHRVSNLAA